MAGKALYVLAGYDDRTEKTLAGMQEKLYKLGFSGVQTKNIPMHFTLGSYHTDQEEALKERLRRIADTREAFKVSFNHVGLFRLPENDVLFIKPEAGRDMLDLKDSFNDDLDTFNWSAHTTLLIDRADVIREALPAVLDEFSPFEGKASFLHLYEFWPARHILSVQLKTLEDDKL